MKVMYPDRILYRIASSEDASYPIANTGDDFTKHVWKATDLSAWVRVHVDNGCSGVGLAYTNAVMVKFTVKNIVSGICTSLSSGKLIDSGATFLASGCAASNFVWNLSTGAAATISSVDGNSQITLSSDIFTAPGQGYSIETGDLFSTYTVNLGAIETYYQLVSDDVNILLRNVLGRSLGYDYGYQYAKHDILIEFYGSTNVFCGVIQAGPIWQFRDPDYGVKEGHRDYSIVKELVNGGLYVKKRNIVKTFDFTIRIQRDYDFYNLFRNVCQFNGKNPLFWWISSDLANMDWQVFARQSVTPTGVHDTPAWSEISISLEEVV